MFKKVVSCLVIVSFVFLNWSCYSTRKRPPDQLANPKVAKAKVLRVLLKSGQTIDFTGGPSARLQGDAVVAGEKTTLMVVADEATTKVSKEGKTYVIQTADGRTYRAKSVKTKKGKVTFSGQTEGLTIPRSDIEFVWTYEYSSDKTVIGIVGVIVLVGLTVGAVIALASKESCPFLYAESASGFTLEGELYSGAILKEIERRDIIKLHHLEAGPGGYVLKIANEAAETQNTDELTLLAVDHAPGLEVYATDDGSVRTVARPAAPASARDLNGRDFTRSLAVSDGDMWSSNPVGKDPENRNDWWSGLDLTFPKPSGAASAKLTVRIGNTYWADAMSGRFFGLMGYMRDTWSQSRGGDPDFRRKAEAFMRDQGIGLKVQVRGKSGWRDAGFFYPTGPYGIEDNVMDLALDDTPDGDLGIRLVGGTFFWMVDSAAVDYTADRAVKVHALSPSEAVDGKGNDVRGLLAAADGAYFTMPETGDYAVVRYPVPPREPGTERSFLIWSKGYYTVHPKEGLTAPDLQTLLAIRQDPSLFLKFSLLEFQKAYKARVLVAPQARGGGAAGGAK